MSQIALSKSTKSIFFYSNDNSNSSDSREKSPNLFTKKSRNLFYYFWKEQFDTFDNQCNVLGQRFVILSMFFFI